MYSEYVAADQIYQYIKEKKEQGVSPEKIRADLLAVGWDKTEIEKGFIQAENPTIPLPPSHPSTQTSQGIIPVPARHMIDSFEQVTLFLSVYVIFGSLSFMLRYFVDKWIPKPALGVPSVYVNPQSPSVLSSIFFYMAALIVSYPIFAFFFYRITKHAKSNPYIRTLLIRKILSYGTLLFSFSILILGIIIFIAKFLEGDISPNLVLHIFITIVISLALFVYYFSEIREDKKVM